MFEAGCDWTHIAGVAGGSMSSKTFATTISCRYTTSGDGSRFFVCLTKRVFFSRLGETKILLESPSSNLRELEIPN
jgi:hypothetical protein